MAPPPKPTFTLTRAVRGAPYAPFLSAFHDSAALAACQDAAGDMEGLCVSGWVPDLDALLSSAPVPGPPGPPTARPPPTTTAPSYRRMQFSPVINEPWLPKLSMFQVTEIHTLEPRADAHAPLRMTGVARLRWASFAKPSHVLDSAIEARPVEWVDGEGEGEPTPGVLLTFSVTPHLPPWAIGPLKKLVLAGIADMFSDFAQRSLAWAVAGVGAELVEDAPEIAQAVDVASAIPSGELGEASASPGEGGQAAAGEP